MFKVIVCLYILLFLIDDEIIHRSRELIFCCVKGKYKRIKSDKLHKQQNLWNRITMRYLCELDKKYQRKFSRYYLLYFFELVTIIPQYISLLLCSIFIQYETRYLLYILVSVKLLASTFLRLQFNACKIPKFVK